MIGRSSIASLPALEGRTKPLRFWPFEARPLLLAFEAFETSSLKPSKSKAFQRFKKNKGLFAAFVLLLNLIQRLCICSNFSLYLQVDKRKQSHFLQVHN